MGSFEEPQGIYDSVMTKYKREAVSGPTPIDKNSESQLWETHYLRCAKELTQGDIILDCAKLHLKKIINNYGKCMARS